MLNKLHYLLIMNRTQFIFWKWLGLWLLVGIEVWAQCTTSNATGCVCPDGSSSCALLPDITVSWSAILNYKGGPNEYSQSGNGANDGRLRLTAATPNIGYGPLTVRGVDRNGYRWFVCGTDTISIYDPQSTQSFSCPNGHIPQQLILQRIYHKNGNVMTYTEHFSGTMTYHPTHGHNHVDDWAIFTLRIEDPNNPDTLSWPIVGEGSKIGFCLMDYGSCNNQALYPGFCRDNQKYNSGRILLQADFPNYGLGGGQYNCSQIQQGISSGYHDVYDEDLDGMWINIPPTTCNGNYWIVVEVDPRNHFVESREDNNWTAVPFTLTKQLPPGNAVASITVSDDRYLCNNESVILTAGPALRYTWNTGATTQSIVVSDPGIYTVQTVSTCGTATATPVEIVKNIVDFTEIIADTSCEARQMILTARGDGLIRWYDVPSGGAWLDTGETFITPVLHTSATYFAEIEKTVATQTTYCGPQQHAGNPYSGNSINGYILFNAYKPFRLVSVKVYTDLAGERLIELRDSQGTVIQSATVYVSSGVSRITLNFDVPVGIGWQLGTNQVHNTNTFGYASPRLRRSDSGVSYPYQIADLVALTGSPYGASYYYYFYDWEIMLAVTCSSPRVAITALVDNIPSVSIDGLDSVYPIHSDPDTLIGIPPGGVFSGPGIADNIFFPQQAGMGTHQITYTYTDSMSGCSNFATRMTEVFELPTYVMVSTQQKGVLIHPNPATDYITCNLIGFAKDQHIMLRIFNTMGAIVIEKHLSLSFKEIINVSMLKRGVYFGEVSSASGIVGFRFFKL